MRRRTALALFGAAGAAAIASRSVAQRRDRLVRLGYVGVSANDPQLRWIRLGLTRSGWLEGRDYVVSARSTGPELNRVPALVDELLRERIDILLTAGLASSVVPIAQHVVPVVFGTSSDPVRAGIVKSFALPGGNATGVSHMAYDLVGKRLQLLRDIAPTVRRAALLSSPQHAGEEEERRVIFEAAGQLALELVPYHVNSKAEITAAMEAAVSAKCDSITSFADPITLTNRDMIAAKARQLNWASTFGRRDFCDAGGLASYGANFAEANARLAYFVQKIAGGARAGELPVEVPTVVETVVNRNTAAAIGLTLTPAVLASADELIE